MRCNIKIKRVLTNKKDAKNTFRVFKAIVSNVELEEKDLKHKIAIQKEMTVKGNLVSCVEGDTYTATCDIDVNPKWGVSLVLREVEIQKYETEDELAKFFEKRIQGVGKKMANQIVEKLGANAIDIIASQNGIKKLLEAKIKGMGPARAEVIRETILYHKNFADIVMFLEVNKLDVKMANILYEEFGKGCLIDLKENPYKFAGYVDFKKLDEVAYMVGMNNLNMNRIKGAIKGYIQFKLDKKGDIYVSVDELKQNLRDYMNSKTLFEPIKEDLDAFIKEALIELNYKGYNANKTSKGNIIVEDMKRVYRRDMYYLETRIAEKLKKIGSKDASYDFETVDTIIDLEEARSGFKLAQKQREAVHLAMENNFFVLCGLPGAGKTSTTNIILRVYRRLQEGFNKEDKTILMAPTGKASRRLSELCGEDAMTIHRALGMKIYDSIDLSKKIDADFIVVDESSMVDIYMFFTLLEKIEEGTKVMFVGDDEQLPSVGAGLVLRDLIDSSKIASIKLTEVFRQASTSDIVYNSHQIIKSNSDFRFGKDTFFTSATSDYRNMYSKITKHYIRLRDLGYQKDEICILAATRKGMFGTEAINKLIQTTNPNQESIRANGYDIKIGDMVMHNTNNYDLGVFNGEIGEVVDFFDSGSCSSITVKYADKEIVYEKDLDHFQELELAYAITIHKSQGSEYKAIIFICVEEHSLMLTKNLVYTGFTRAKELLSIIGQKEALIASADKKTQISRKSYLVERLEGVC